ncbi:hypothetical protein ACSMXN_15390 [Jatrophihabitans sp. DSM 45814]
MSVRAGTSRHLNKADALLAALAVATVALLAIDAYVHLHDAHLYDTPAGGSITQASLFRAEAGVAIVVAIVLLISRHWIAWLIAALVAGSAAAAVFVYTNIDVGSIGPLPNMYEPTWALPGKRLSAIAEIAAFVIAVIGLIVSLRLRRNAR